jgi:hypothetical protein
MGRRLALGVMCIALAGCGGNEPVGATSDQAADKFASWYRGAVHAGGDTIPAKYRADNPSSDAAIKALIRRLCEIDLDQPQRHPPADSLKNDPAFFGNPGFASAAIMHARLACGLLD